MLWLIYGACFFAALRYFPADRWLVLGLVTLAAGSGSVLGGVALFYDSSVRQWPVLSRFLNREAIMRASEETTLQEGKHV